MNEALRRPSLVSREIGRPILVFTGDTEPANKAGDTARYFYRRAPHAEINAEDFSDVTAIVEQVAGVNGLLARWVKGTLLPPLRFPLTRFVLWREDGARFHR
ncbi:hypothetical protein [Streptosporangium sp. V21-05]|uniref:hypothetical protein n=1 Tax=Streptosporangium sp. V21-05 TaxID=3446115 RepID=UPI003F52C29E